MRRMFRAPWLMATVVVCATLGSTASICWAQEDVDKTGEDEAVSVLAPLPRAEPPTAEVTVSVLAPLPKKTEEPQIARSSAAPPAAIPKPAAPRPPDTPPRPDDVSAARSAVDAWASAWAEQRVGDYLAAYADNFEPQDGSSRFEWQTQRRQRLQAPAWIRLELTPLGTPWRVAEGRVVMTFLQSYTSNTFSDVVRKTLELVQEDGRFKISRERSEPWEG